MAKLADLLGKYLVEWPDGAQYAWQDYDGEVRFQYHDGMHYPSNLTLTDIAIDHVRRMREQNPNIGVTKQQYLAARDRIAAEACTDLPKTDRKLWKRAALAAFSGYCARPCMDAECAAEEAMFAADAFMNAMEKHLKGGV